ncbi:alkaline phosphatase D family protein [Rhabdothermincola sediminis]|uniref:alkaline phosphatase D family protein n=1 Tax=Rhabdothermincola sediminis TaxID=2751370 RepID=UPI001AA09DD8|nr:alkaline phosphatase D family protein [Rhabdothermincola sediminis]
MATPSITRRSFLAGTIAAIAAARWQGSGQALPADVTLPDDPFTLGVASGDPDPGGFVIWTRLAPAPTSGGGMPGVDLPVTWEVATDPSFATIVASGVSVAVVALAHSVHVEVSGLPPDAWFHYRFRAGGWTSPVGRARTAPAPGVRAPLRFGVASCQRYVDGYYTAHRALSTEGCDLVVHLGDYIYEGGGSGPVRSHGSPEATTLAGYRNRYGLYKSDPDLQAAHAMCPWLVVWDDHEVDNDYAGVHSADGVPEGEFLSRRAQAYQAWYEHLPVRLRVPAGPNVVIHRSIRWGGLARFHLLDTRQHRDPQPCGGGLSSPCGDWDDEGRTLLGPSQEAWLLDALGSREAVWEVLANQVVFAPMPIGTARNMDQWDGYPAARQRLWSVLRDVPNPVVVTGDIHLGALAKLHRELEDPSTPPVGVELVGPPISSRFTAAPPAVVEAVVGALPWFEHVNASDRGYLIVELTEDALQARYRVVSTTAERTATVSTDHTYRQTAVPVPRDEDPVDTTTTTSTSSPPSSTSTAVTTTSPPAGGSEDRSGELAPGAVIPRYTG